MWFKQLVRDIKKVRLLWVLLLISLGSYGVLNSAGISIGRFFENMAMGLAFGTAACFIGAVILRYTMPIGYSIASLITDMVLMGLTAIVLKWIGSMAYIPEIGTMYMYVAYACLGCLTVYTYAFRR